MCTDTDQLLDVASYTGKLPIGSGAGIYRVEEAIVRFCTGFSEVEDTQSFITTTGIVSFIMVASRTRTKILCVYTCGANLNCIDKINNLSRETAVQSYTVEELALKLREIEDGQHYFSWIIMFFGASSAGGFTVFFGGNCLEAGRSFLIGLLIKVVSALMEQHDLHGLSTNAIAATSGALAALGAHALYPDMDVDILIIFSIVLLVSGLAITNAMRDTVSGGYLSGVTRATEALLVATTIAASISVTPSMPIGLSKGM